jgi:hypothetical protein
MISSINLRFSKLLETQRAYLVGEIGFGGMFFDFSALDQVLFTWSDTLFEERASRIQRTGSSF